MRCTEAACSQLSVNLCVCLTSVTLYSETEGHTYTWLYPLSNR